MKPALDVGEVQSRNFRAIRDWIESNKSRIKARPNRSVVYSGLDYDVTAKLDRNDRAVFVREAMWERLGQLRKKLKADHAPCDFQTLEDVLTGLRDYPEVVDRDRQRYLCRNAKEFFFALEKDKSLDALIPNRRKVAADAWDRLSALYTANAAGDIKFMIGSADDYRRISLNKIFVRTELGTLLKNPALSETGKAALLQQIEEFGSFFDRRQKADIARLDREVAALKKPRA